MDFDELLDKVKKENPDDRLTIELAQLAADMATETIRELELRYVIRCKDCKWYERDKQKGGFCRKSGAAMWSPGLPYDELKPDDYCSRAKRKENINGD